MGLALLCKNQYFFKVILTTVVLVCILAFGLVMHFLDSLLPSVCKELSSSRNIVAIGWEKINFTPLLH
jgi:hypothetical protein